MSKNERRRRERVKEAWTTRRRDARRVSYGGRYGVTCSTRTRELGRSFATGRKRGTGLKNKESGTKRGTEERRSYDKAERKLSTTVGRIKRDGDNGQ